ncbi:hypothetical protein DFH06DRAFT_459911 [Mycena polygramma]|nr:hypothetical protein DFH06DRAFT_459911 [Mycena polygramma]
MGSVRLWMGVCVSSAVPGMLARGRGGRVPNARHVDKPRCLPSVGIAPDRGMGSMRDALSPAPRGVYRSIASHPRQRYELRASRCDLGVDAFMHGMCILHACEVRRWRCVGRRGGGRRWMSVSCFSSSSFSFFAIPPFALLPDVPDTLRRSSYLSISTTPRPCA